MKKNFLFFFKNISFLNFIFFIISYGLIFFTFKSFILERFKNRYVGYDADESFEGSKLDAKWAKEIIKGGYILHFRHAERDKWIDVQMYDSLESDVKNSEELRKAENDYFRKAVCLNQRGEVQARAIGEHLKNINLPIGYVISSTSCRSRQTAELAFGGYEDTNRDLVHIGPYTENRDDRVKKLTDIYSNLPIKEGTNTIVSAHNGVILNSMFINSEKAGKKPFLEEGGFYVISQNKKGLKLEHKFYYFKDFIKHFYKR